MYSSHLHSPKSITRLCVRIGFGLSLAFVGFAHYQDPSYAEAVGRGLGVLESLGMVWGYILPGLMIIGGLLLAFGIYVDIAAYAAGIALASVPAGLMLKSAITGIPLDETMPPAMNALVWILVLMVAVKGTRDACHCSDGCCCGENCNCEVESMSKPAVKSMPVMHAVAKKPTKKTARRKK